MDSHRSGDSTRAHPAQSAPTNSVADPPDATHALREEIRQSAQQLRLTYCVVATTERVLRLRGLDEDLELAGWLRWGVLNPLGREVERLSCRVVELGGDAVILP